MVSALVSAVATSDRSEVVVVDVHCEVMIGGANPETLAAGAHAAAPTRMAFLRMCFMMLVNDMERFLKRGRWWR